MALIRGSPLIVAQHFLAACCLVGQSAGPVRVVGKLEPHSVIERELGNGQTDEYTVEVKAGQFVRVVARQMGVDVVVTVLDPLGKTVLEADRGNGAFGPESASFIGETSGEYRVRVSTGQGSPGRYQMELLESREPTQADRDRIEAERAEFEAGRESQGSTREGKLHAIELNQRAASIWRRVEDTYEEGLSLHVAASLYDDLGERQKALDYYGQALRLRHGIGDRSGESATLTGIGSVYAALGQKQKALEYYSKALPLIRAAGDQAGEAATLNNIGLAYYSLGEKQKALDNYSQALLHFRAAGDQSGAAIALNDIGTIYSALGEKRKALDYYSRALPLHRAAGNQSEQATTLNNIGRVYDDLGERQKALDYYGQALSLSHTAGSQSGEATPLYNIGLVYDALGDKQKALDYYSRAAALRRAAGDQSGEAIILKSMGAVYAALGEPQKALDYYGQALSRSRAGGDRSVEATALNDIGAVYDDLGEKLKALDNYGKALSIFRAAGRRQAEAATLGNIGKVYSDLGEKQKALEYFGKELPISQAIGDRAGAARTLNSIGGVYGALGEQQKALAYYQRALPLHLAARDPAGEATTLNNIGLVYDLLGNKQKALDYYWRALPLYRSAGDRSGEAITLNNAGRVYFELRDKEKALDNLGQALRISRAAGGRPDEAITLNNIGRVYDDFGEKQKALDYYGQALPLFRAVGNRTGEAHTLNSISTIFEKSQPELAILLAKQAVNLLQTIRRDNRGLEKSLRRSYEKSIESNYRHLAGLLVDRQRFGEAEEVLNLLKDKEAADFIRRDAVADQLRPATLSELERKALERYEQILTQIVPEGQAKSALVAKAATAALNDAEADRSRQLDLDLAAASTVLLKYFDEEEKTLAANSAAATRMRELRESEGLQDTLQALGPDVVAIYTLVLPDKYTALLVTSGTRRAYSTAIQEKELNRKIFEFRQQLQTAKSNPLPLAKELYRILFPEGLRQDLDTMGAKTLMWSIDSTVRYVPMAALYDGKQYLVARFRNSLITPNSLMRLTEGSQALWRGVGFGVSKANREFSALPSVPEELHRIFRQGDSGDAPVAGRVRLDGDFTREAFAAGMRQPEKSVVHVATHFDSRPGVAANSHLLLGDGSEMSLEEIAATPRLFSGVDLLTLSACSTAFTNSSEDGREVDSFGTIAQRLGAKGVIASLWSVSDEATARLMETMYRIRQSQPALGKSEALRQAQAQMASGILKPATGHAENRGAHLTGGQGGAHGWTHPYYWAPFILIGNWK
jgi:tetratricopeptide (TPR) repeat protein/CHAT domain-containing protein